MNRASNDFKDSDTENESEDLFVVIEDLKKDFDTIEEKYMKERSLGFENNQKEDLAVSFVYFLTNK